MTTESNMGRFGPHTAVVDELLNWISTGNLLRFRSTPPSDLFLRISTLDEALVTARGRQAGHADWTAIRENADAMLHDVGLLESDDWLPYKVEIENLLFEVGRRVEAVLPDLYWPILDDVVADLHACALCLVVHGKLDEFHKIISEAYHSGGWPCGAVKTDQLPPFLNLINKQSLVSIDGYVFYLLWSKCA